MEKNTSTMKYVILADSKSYLEFEKPRHLTEINGEPILKRTVRLLKENGIKDILITSHDKRYNNLGATRYVPKHNDWNQLTGEGYWISAFPIELLNQPICFIWGDVYFSENAIKTIVETQTDSTLFFCTYKNNNAKYIKNWDEPLAYKVVDYKLFKRKIKELKKLKDEKVCWREPIVWELYRIINGQCVNEHKMTKNYLAINDESCDIDSVHDIILLNIRLGGIKLVKVEAIKQFTLGKFDEITNIVRKSADTKGMLYVGDTFECTQEMAEYLTGKNDRGNVVVKIVEVIPEKEVAKEEPKVEEKKEIKTIFKSVKKKTSKK